MDTKLLVVFLVLIGLVSLGQASRCGRIFANKVSKTDATVIVDAHNEYRKRIANGEVSGQPRGINLKRMKYDEKLAAEAQKIANTCEFAHKHVEDGRWTVGQNLYIEYSTAPSKTANWKKAVESWFNEQEYYKYGPCCEHGPEQTGHYTQVVWADTEYVGCGYAYYDSKDFFKYHKLFVCNYGPAGNYIGQLPYQSGKSGCEDLC